MQDLYAGQRLKTIKDICTLPTISEAEKSIIRNHKKRERKKNQPASASSSSSAVTFFEAGHDDTDTTASASSASSTASSSSSAAESSEIKPFMAVEPETVVEENRGKDEAKISNSVDLKEPEREDDEDEYEYKDEKPASSSTVAMAKPSPSKRSLKREAQEKSQHQRQLAWQEKLNDYIDKVFSAQYKTVSWGDWDRALQNNGYTIAPGSKGKRDFVNTSTGKRFAVENPHGEGANKFSPANIGVIRTFCLDQGLAPNGALPNHMIQPWLRALQTKSN